MKPTNVVLLIHHHYPVWATLENKPKVTNKSHKLKNNLLYGFITLENHCLISISELKFGISIIAISDNTHFLPTLTKEILFINLSRNPNLYAT
jgi:hypothetical protein